MALSTDRRRARIASYVPLRVTARLRCGVISDGMLPLDGALYAAQHRDTRPAQDVTLPRAAVRAGDAVGHLPIKRIPIERSPDRWMPDFYYAASCAQWPEAIAEGVDHWTKRIDSRYVDLLKPQTARVPTSGGIYRGYRMPVAYRHAIAIHWYVVGEPERIRALLALVTHLGNKREMGWGAVMDWTVEPHEADWSVTGPSGDLMRPIPDPDGILYGIRPPYWLPRHQVPCRLPAVAS